MNTKHTDRTQAHTDKKTILKLTDQAAEIIKNKEKFNQNPGTVFCNSTNQLIKEL